MYCFVAAIVLPVQQARLGKMELSDTLPIIKGFAIKIKIQFQTLVSPNS